ncbi:metal ABC transporter substrate-binding protein [Halobaculum halobium]|uniref:Metal ABC transporter substrate-binding protein n=1 Tax=Halobaculum halobium TaxID=3032281 RepID=A0ABD5TD56_9EURY|nr:metal ABC transporter substrate-binding protein [Halobaculum sp. SYNS20]
MERTRRAVIGSVGAIGAGALAGCLGSRPGSGDSDGGGTGSDGDATAQATFFVFGDVASAVAGDATSTDLLVPVGQHGHGWEPGPRVRESIRAADLLVHGMTGFQPWVDDVAADLAADDAAVDTVDASADVALLPATGEHGHDHGGDEHDDDEYHEGDHTETEHHDDHTETEHHDDHDEGDDDHDRHAGEYDPHFWMDPLRVADAVDTVEAALTEANPDGSEAHAANAAALREELTALDERIESLVADAGERVLLVAGHNSFQYLGDRYGLHVEALTGLSPDDQPTTRDIERAQEVIAEHGVRYVCADPLESQRAADQLVAETDAEAVLPLTAMPGLTDEWAENDWGYLDVMREVNVPTLDRVLSR